mmetsp:Transcript_40644/g.73300  ORF Transcript_40644/g.73300 Transcript_40644/m.73300 type:complete len:129 (+) Transcript_40644:233-619(+)|eukprot:CAMPEP_0201865972 /NCGR_PEP_ID=MMETSP0902-20130614/709_1 /ASSEMBLY_ACC=CAM_ASM_000551 /TAXON_ID=420261 /ORGANISM="Thalassiosira antarctica, Strain CCMP982" /LENGTH=128 /DNA_ID=CAMNT_0048390849 /DNA_START=226 /DNA_END=612 /DNA_ORIENTATION=-
MSIRTTCTILALFLSGSASAWAPIATLLQSRVVTPPITTALLSTPDANNPCWQDNYDSEDDCMSTVYSAAFVPEEWIKSMPCGKDADCLPEKLTHPGTMGDAGVEKVDVMEYLNIRKAAPVSEKAAGP